MRLVRSFTPTLEKLPPLEVSAADNSSDAGSAIARLSGLEGLARSIPSAIVPLIALDALGSKAAVSYAYLGGSILALVATLNVGRLDNMMARRWIVTLSMALLATASVVLTFADGPLFVLGLGLLASEASIFSVTLSLYILDNIERRHLGFNEARRMVRNGWAWAIGPVLAVWLWSRYGRGVPLSLSIAFSGLALWYFWVMRLGPTQTFTPKSIAPSPLQNIPRFFRQRYLRIAYAVTLTRGLFWASLFIYAPLYVIEAGLPVWMAGAFLSTVASLLMLSPFVHRLSGRFGARAVIVSGFCSLGSSLIVLAALGEPKPIGVVVWVWAAAGASSIDVVNNVPFMRTVRPRQRVEMTTVFSTWREVSSLLAPAIAAATLAVAPFWTFYLVLAAFAFLAAVTATHLPRRL